MVSPSQYIRPSSRYVYIPRTYLSRYYPSYYVSVYDDPLSPGVLIGIGVFVLVLILIAICAKRSSRRYRYSTYDSDHHVEDIYDHHGGYNDHHGGYNENIVI